MKFLKKLFLFGLFLLSATARSYAQQAISVDAGCTMNLKNSSSGINLSSFYHFTEHLSGGLEMNRFFEHHWLNKNEDITVSAWDFDLNFHYNFNLTGKLCVYPLAGISHTSEKEMEMNWTEPEYKRFFSFNTGAGIFLKLKRISPFAECMYTWGQLNQRFFLAGIGYEFELKKK